MITPITVTPDLIRGDEGICNDRTPAADPQLLSPAMAAGVTDRLWSLEDVIAKIDELAPAPKVRGPYKKRGDENSN